MKRISTLIRNIRNLIPYLIVVSVYFFFVNLEARNEKYNNKNSGNKDIISNYNSPVEDKNPRINIPVIPYNE